MSRRSVFTLSFVAATLAASTALAQPAPEGGRPFGDRPGSNHGGPFTPGVDGPAGPYTPGTAPGGEGSGPFTPGADGPRGPYTPGNVDAPTSGGPFSDRGEGGGFWGSVKNFGRSVWSGLKSVGSFIWNLGGWAPWAHMPASGTIAGGYGNNAGRNDDTAARPPLSAPERVGTPVATGPGNSGLPGHELPSGATAGEEQPTRLERPSATFLRP